MKPLPQSDLDNIVARCRGLVIPSPILITGATGFLGRWMVESANAMGHYVYAIARNIGNAQRGPLVGYSKCDVKNLDYYSINEPAVPPASIIHLAGGEFEPDETADTIVNGTRAVIRFAQRYGCRLLNVSSGAAGCRDTVYAHAKRLGELLCNASGVDCVHARIWACMGQGLPLDRQWAAGNFVRDALAGGPVRVTGDGLAVRTYIEALDLTVWLWHLLAKGQAGQWYDVGGTETYTIADVAKEVARQAGCGVEFAQPSSEAESRIARDWYVPQEVRRTEREIGVGREFTLADKVERMLAQ